MTYAQSGFKIDGEWLDLSKVGRLWMVLHRPIEGKIKTLTIRRSSTNKWYVCFSCEIEPPQAPGGNLRELAAALDQTYCHQLTR